MIYDKMFNINPWLLYDFLFMEVDYATTGWLVIHFIIITGDILTKLITQDTHESPNYFR